jgi:REP-associated tyrosine transposase
MARSLRIELTHGWYHVLSRGVERRQIFPDQQANLHFLKLLGCLPSRFAVRIHGYVLMGNHYHLQLETRQANLSRAMQRLNLSYGAVNAAIARFEPRQKIDRDLQEKLKKIAKQLKTEI